MFRSLVVFFMIVSIKKIGTQDFDNFLGEDPWGSRRGGESRRLFQEVQPGEHREFDNERMFRAFQAPIPQHHWHSKGFDYNTLQKAVFKGIISCSGSIGLSHERDFSAVNAERSFEIKKIQVFNDDKEELFPLVRNGKNFVAYEEEPENDGTMKFARVLIESKGCVGNGFGCRAITQVMGSYQSGKSQELSFMRIDLDSRYYEKDCSVLRGVADLFWPF